MDRNEKDNAAFDFWQDHSMQYLEMAFRTDRWEIMDDPDGYGMNQGVCGDAVDMFLTLASDRIRSVAFRVNGCRNTNACANTVADLAEGKTLDEAWKLTPEDVVEFLETLPAEHKHCANLAVGAFYKALRAAVRRQAPA